MAHLSKEKQTVQILVIEDNEGDVRLIQESLRRCRICKTLTAFSTGDEALDYLRGSIGDEGKPMPNLVLLDLSLPGKSGIEVLDQIRKTPELTHIPVVIMTASNSEKDIISSYELKANAYVVKPISTEKFTEIVISLCDFWFETVKLP